MKKTTYIRDIEDTLGKNDFSKNAVRIAKKIQSTQKKAFPSIEFKQHLWDRLSNIHALQLEEDANPKFSLLQIVAGFASFIIITGGIFSIYQMSSMPNLKISEQSTISTLPSTISRDSSVINEDIWNKEVPLWEAISPQMMWIPEIVSPDNEMSDNNYNDSQSTIVNYENNPSIEVESDFSSQDNAESSIFESTLRDGDLWNANNDFAAQQAMDITRQEMCELAWGEYQWDPEICSFPNWVQCWDYSEKSILACAQRDGAVSE